MLQQEPGTLAREGKRRQRELEERHHCYSVKHNPALYLLSITNNRANRLSHLRIRERANKRLSTETEEQVMILDSMLRHFMLMTPPFSVKQWNLLIMRLSLQQIVSASSLSVFKRDICGYRSNLI